MNLPERYAGLIFDCDGTLTDSMPLHYAAWVEALTRHGLTFPEPRFYAMGGVPTGKIIEMLSAEQGVPVDVVAVGIEKEELFLTKLSQVVANEPVCQVARNYRGKLPMAVASGGARDIVRDQLVTIGMEDCFDAIVGAEDTALHKPNPDVFLEAANRIGVPPETCLVFEDTDIGIEAACRAGMDYVDVRKFAAGPQRGKVAQHGAVPSQSR
jgi:beta-phosphoglucomutase-like phosphatase (HAD superfamily)